MGGGVSHNYQFGGNITRFERRESRQRIVNHVVIARARSDMTVLIPALLANLPDAAGRVVRNTQHHPVRRRTVTDNNQVVSGA